eukprot:1158221-Pelagomonas_calceolata.AAC.1
MGEVKQAESVLYAMIVSFVQLLNPLPKQRFVPFTLGTPENCINTSKKMTKVTLDSPSNASDGCTGGPCAFAGELVTLDDASRWASGVLIVGALTTLAVQRVARSR